MFNKCVEKRRNLTLKHTSKLKTRNKNCNDDFKIIKNEAIKKHVISYFNVTLPEKMLATILNTYGYILTNLQCIGL